MYIGMLTHAVMLLCCVHYIRAWHSFWPCHISFESSDEYHNVMFFFGLLKVREREVNDLDIDFHIFLYCHHDCIIQRSFVKMSEQFASRSVIHIY